MTAHDHDLDPACAETTGPDGSVRGACRCNEPTTVRQNPDPAPERDQIADAEQTYALLVRVVAHRNEFIGRALSAAEYADLDKATKYMHAANEFDRMATTLERAGRELER